MKIILSIRCGKDEATARGEGKNLAWAVSNAMRNFIEIVGADYYASHPVVSISIMSIIP